MFLIAESTAKKSRRRKQNKEKTSPEVWIHQNFCLEWRQKAKKVLVWPPQRKLMLFCFWNFLRSVSLTKFGSFDPLKSWVTKTAKSKYLKNDYNMLKSIHLANPMNLKVFKNSYKLKGKMIKYQEFCCF